MVAPGSSPREWGEACAGRRRWHLPGLLLAGSSPREWGEVGVKRLRDHALRFIPTRVGRGSASCCSWRERAVHPHASGERHTECHETDQADGSSPREWGEALAASSRRRARRFIPTRVGRGVPSPCPHAASSVHPHASGERPIAPSPALSASGSSPREWGEGTTAVGDEGADRFIPTRVGRGRPMAARTVSTAVHPHASGERSAVESPSASISGSSPREWGEAWAINFQTSKARFIPTRVGRGGTGAPPCPAPPVHPHASGERVRPAPGARSRGRFIPTRVGRGTRRAVAGSCSEAGENSVHPHASGERSKDRT